MNNNGNSASSGKRLSAWKRAFIVLFFVFVTAGFCTIGSFKSTGKSFSYAQGSGNTAVYELNYESGQSKLKAVYMNIGNIYLEPGEEMKITIKRSTSTSSTVKPATSCGTLSVGNFYSSKTGVSGGNFNWICVVNNGDSPQIAYRISVAADANFDLNEIVCLASDGTKIPLSVNTDVNSDFTEDELKLAIDAQDSFTTSNSSFRNFTPEEGYYMTSVRTVLGGRQVIDGSVYNVDRDFNSLATVLLLPSVALFGNSVAALRLVPMLATAVSLLFVYLLGGLLFKEEKYAFVFALLFALGGYAATVGRLGAPYALIVCALLGSLYFMYRFFSGGISSEKPVRGGLNILFSGIFGAVALSMNILTVFPVAGILVLFAFGLRRMKLAYLNEQNRVKAEAENAESPSSEEENGEQEGSETAGIVGETRAESSTGAEGKEKEALSNGAKLKKLKGDYVYKTKLSWGFAAMSFVVIAFLLTVLAGAVTYNAYVKVYDDPVSPALGYTTLLWKGISAPFSIDNITEFTSANAVSAFAWFMPLKAATVYDGVLASSADSSRYLAWNVSMNTAASFLSLLAFSFSTVSVIADCFAENRGSKEIKRMRRIYLVLLGGIVTCILSSVFVKNTSAVQGMTFSAFYVGFIPLAAMMIRPSEPRLKKNGKPAATFSDVLMWTVVALVALFFVLSVPSAYGFEIAAKAQKALFNWMSIFSNGYVGLKGSK